MPSAPSRPGTRERIITAAMELFRRQGFAATGIKAILTASETPYGSLYHFFPGGKQQLGVAAIESSGAVYRELVEAFFDEYPDPATTLAAFFDGAADVVESTDYADACPIATIAGEIAGTDEPMRQAAAGVFASWLGVLTDRLTAAGVGPDVAHDLAIEVFCLIEGAFLLARTTRDAAPVRIAGRRAAASVADALAPA